jgi:hypothetical protein
LSIPKPKDLFCNIKTMSNAPVVQIPRNLLFRYRFELHQVIDGPKAPTILSPAHRIRGLGRFDSQLSFAEWHGGWSAEGLYFNCEVRNKKQALWCRPQMLLESDSFQIWVDTRATQNVHRATRYCHWFLVLPGSSDAGSPAVASMLKINRAKEDSPTINRGKLLVKRQLHSDGYALQLFIPAVCLNGWNPTEHQTIGLNLASLDREFGSQTLGVGLDLPVAEDPSLWSTAKLCQSSDSPTAERPTSRSKTSPTKGNTKR